MCTETKDRWKCLCVLRKALKKLLQMALLRKGKLGRKCGERQLNYLQYHLEINATITENLT